MLYVEGGHISNYKENEPELCLFLEGKLYPCNKYVLYVCKQFQKKNYTIDLIKHWCV